MRFDDSQVPFRSFYSATLRELVFYRSFIGRYSGNIVELWSQQRNATKGSLLGAVAHFVDIINAYDRPLGDTPLFFVPTAYYKEDERINTR